jgi:hypothetical protein
VFAADPAVRARCEATSAENLKMKAAMKAEFLEQEKAKVRGNARQLRLLRALALTRCVCVPPFALRAGGRGCCFIGGGCSRP